MCYVPVQTLRTRRGHMFLLKKLSMKIDRFSQNPWVWVSLVPFVGFLVVLMGVIAPTIPPPGVPDDWQRVFTSEDLVNFLKNNPASVLESLRLGGAIDCLAPLAYGGPFAFALSRWFNAGWLPTWHPMRVVNLLPILIGLLDEVENVGLLLAYDAYPEAHWGADLAGQVTMAKWMAIYIMWFLLVAGLLGRAIKLARREEAYDF